MVQGEGVQQNNEQTIHNNTRIRKKERKKEKVSIMDEKHMANASKAYQTSVRYNWKHILDGRVLVVDPSSGGKSSLPAICVIQKGKIGKPKEIPVSAKYRNRASHAPHRLQEIGTWLRTKLIGKFDLLAMELIHWSPSKNTVMVSYFNLVQSIGAIHASVDADYRLVIPPWSWRELAPEGYRKSDLGDVSLMAKTLLQDAKRYSEAA